jgi:hypothetical protein
LKKTYCTLSGLKVVPAAAKRLFSEKQKKKAKKAVASEA